MLNNQFFQVALALLFVFLVMAAIVSLVQQAVVQVFRLRALTLRHTIETMLRDEEAYPKKEISTRFFRHPMTSTLSGGKAQSTEISADAFVVALGAAVQPTWSTGDPVDALPASVAALKAGPLKRRLSLVMPAPGADRAAIVKSVGAWFEAAEKKMSQRFTADCIALSYLVAVIVTIALNVSTLEIVNRLQSNTQLRQAFATSVPGLANQVMGFANTDAASVGAQTANTSAPPTATTGAQHFDQTQTVALLTVFNCASSRTDLPVGWDFMADALKRIRGVVNDRNDPCNVATQQANADPVVRQSLLAFQNTAPENLRAATTTHIYGPTFERNGIPAVLLGWLITIIAAAQGAPFWFNAIKRISLR